MRSRNRAARLVSAPQEWTRRKLQVLLVAGAVVVGAVAVGVLWSVLGLLDGGHHGDADPGGVEVDDPLTLDDPGVAGELAQPGALSTGSTGTIRLPQPSTLGPAQVATGFSRTPQGALAQLAAIDRRAIESASVVTAQDVITAWAAPGGPTAADWSGVDAVSVLLTSAGLPASGTTELQIELRAAMGYIRDQHTERGFLSAVTPCVDFVLTVSTAGAEPSRVAVADCQRMVWDPNPKASTASGRWVIGAGPEPGPSPSLWPGTQASYDAGYQWLEVQ